MKKRKQSKCAVVVSYPGYGGFPVKNVSHWRVDKFYDTSTGKDYFVVTVHFKKGGQMHLPREVTEEMFTSQLFGHPF